MVEVSNMHRGFEVSWKLIDAGAARFFIHWADKIATNKGLRGSEKSRRCRTWQRWSLSPIHNAGVQDASTSTHIQFKFLVKRAVFFLDLFTTIFQTLFKPTSTAAWGPPTLRDKSWCELLRLWRNFLNSKLCRSWMRWTEWLKTTPIWRLVDADVWS